jgi:hypothetical protein
MRAAAAPGNIFHRRQLFLTPQPLFGRFGQIFLPPLGGPGLGFLLRGEAPAGPAWLHTTTYSK